MEDELNDLTKAFIKVFHHNIELRIQRNFLVEFLESIKEDVKQNRPIEDRINEFLSDHLKHYEAIDAQLDNDQQLQGLYDGIDDTLKIKSFCEAYSIPY